MPPSESGVVVIELVVTERTVAHWSGFAVVFLIVSPSSMFFEPILVSLSVVVVPVPLSLPVISALSVKVVEDLEAYL